MTARRCVPGAILAAYLIAGGVAAGTRDPFAPPVAGSLGAEGTPLQRIDPGRLRLVAVVSDTSAAHAAKALLEDETGLGYIATVGTPVGRRGGVVVSMGRGWLRIREPDEPDGPGNGPSHPPAEPEQSAIVLEMSSMAERR